MPGLYNPPNKGEAFAFIVSLPSYSEPGRFVLNPTLAAGDVKVSVDGGSLNNITTLPTVAPAGSQNVLVSLSASEMTGDIIAICFRDATSPPEWNDFTLSIPTTAP